MREKERRSIDYVVIIYYVVIVDSFSTIQTIVITALLRILCSIGTCLEHGSGF
jgi:hypothetical protein